jgi:amino acid adenylation domain-containing protein
VVGLLGILKSGGAYVPLDPAYPLQRLRHMLADSGPRVVLTTEALAELVSASSAPVIVLDASSKSARTQPNHNPDARHHGLAATHLAYVIYTSGSTGLPKGVMVEHRSLVNFVTWRQRSSKLPRRGVFLQKTSISFDVSLAEMLSPLSVGALLVIAKAGREQDPDYIRELIARHQVISVGFVPSMLKVALSDWSKCASLTSVGSGGEELTPALAAEFRAVAGPDCVLSNVYGPTETTLMVTRHQYGSLPSGSGTVPIGTPIANVVLYVMDDSQRPVPVGVDGELYIGGDCVARGYINHEELTAQKFVSNPLRHIHAHIDRLYRTGDRVRWLPDGNLEFRGRIDNQVKLRGYRIELGEIESRLSRHAQVKDAVVLARDQGGGDKCLVGYIKVAGELAPSVEELRKYLRESLPEYMIPSAIVVVDEWPLSPNGKLDRAKLPAPEAFAYAVRSYEAPQGGMEEIVAAIWREILQADQVGRHDNFFALGGHSLRAVQVVARLRAYMEIDVPLRMLFERPTLTAFAGAIVERFIETHQLESQSLSEILSEPLLGLPLEGDASPLPFR